MEEEIYVFEEEENECENKGGNSLFFIHLISNYSRFIYYITT
jgi:hypothetical protein